MSVKGIFIMEKIKKKYCQRKQSSRKQEILKRQGETSQAVHLRAFYRLMMETTKNAVISLETG